ncbi:hypothetical protein WN943_009076 [Citrus x changshan-huyou]|uniref:uncharacterized protein LOC102627061 isoform X1 n=1 Tax=Citrus sinensis TaxID=2711 RepID=UPI000CED29ED|nr:uncharacterized protein LOC102627061 isoform X1 [Citrus sinensis]XP_024039070.1 uncharacterized protein LOC18040375 isoform X1 [Citrus x clementina]XP_024039071.1 uncharacterized protein LOC18040375 isoform X1 [Citrus x clementina]XP_052296926.1 uncharacterized protein LOC102627061 isoform X1 [Citrus sinensis]
MDKTRDVRRGGSSRFSRQKLLAGLEKPKKERLVKKLSVVVNKAVISSFEDSEMGYHSNNLSDRENETPSQSQSSMSNATAKRFKLPKKFLDDCNGVDHSSIPRKLRSAVKKRNPESMSPPLPDSKKLNHTVGEMESLKKDGLKKSKLNIVKQGSSDWSQKEVIGPITKDEEEVVETLYAMAGMFPENDSVNNSKLESAPSEAKPPALQEHRESCTPAVKDSAVTEEELGSTFPLRTSEAAPSSNVESSQKETAKTSAEVEEKPDSKSFHVKTDSCVPPVNVHSTMPLLAKREHNSDEPSCNPVTFQGLPEPCRDSGSLEQSTQETSLTGKPELAVGSTTLRSEQVQQDTATESWRNGLALWPGLSPMVLLGAGSSGPSLPSSATKIPAWLDAAVGASKPCSLENGPSTRKAFKGATTNRSLKRCAGHVYISRLIRDLQMPENKEKSHLQCNQLKPPDEGQRQETHMVIYDFDKTRKGLNGVISVNSIGSTTAERNSSEARSGILQHKRLHHDQLQTATESGLQTLQKQSFNFLSLSAGGLGAEDTNSFSRTRNNALEPSSEFQVSHLHSLPQHQNFMPIAMPQTHYTSSYPDKISTSGTGSTQQVKLQLPSYLSSPFLGPAHTSSTILTKQHQQQQQQLWPAQLAAQCRPTGHSTAMSQFSNWPNGRQDPTLIPCPQSPISPAPTSLEVLRPKYSTNSQHQHQHWLQHQQLMTITSSLPSSRVKRQDHHLPLVYEEIEGGFRTGSSLSLQLLCNERL